MTDQMMASDKKRLKNMIGTISNTDIKMIEDAIKLHLNFSK